MWALLGRQSEKRAAILLTKLQKINPEVFALVLTEALIGNEKVYNIRKFA